MSKLAEPCLLPILNTLKLTMNDHLITKATFTRLLQEVLDDPSLNTKCFCHVIDATKTRILAWPTGQPNNPYLLKIGLQRFIAYNCKDRNGQIYWRFREFEEGSESPAAKPEIKPTTQTTTPKKTALEHHWAPLVQEKAPQITINQPLSETPASSVDRLAKFKERQEKAKQAQQINNHEPINPINATPPESISQ